MCENNTYDNKIDVWSVGLIFGEMLKRTVILRVRCRACACDFAPDLVHTFTLLAIQGRDYVDQLRLTVRLLGEVSADDLRAIEFVALSGPFFATRPDIYSVLPSLLLRSKRGARDLIQRWTYPGMVFPMSVFCVSPLHHPQHVTWHGIMSLTGF